METVAVHNHSWAEHRYIVFLFYIFAVGLILYPVSLSPFSLIVGHEQATAGCHVWVLWWAQQGLSNIETDLIFFPYGGDVMTLYGSDVLSPLLLSWIPFSAVFLYNMWVWLLLVIGGMGIRELALYEKSPAVGAFVGGLVFLSAPFFLHELLNGTSEILASGFVPWFLLFLRKVFDGAEKRDALLLGVISGMSVMSSVYNAFFMLLLTVIFLVGQTLVRREPLWSLERVQSIALSLLVFSPFLSFVAWLQLGHGAKETASRREDWMSKEESLPDSFASLEDWFDPRAVELPTMMPLPDGSSFEYWTLCTVYIGWVSLILVLLSLRKKRDFYVWSGLIAGCIAMGPYVRIGGAVVWDGVLLPLSTMVYLFPPLSIVALHAYRFSAVVVLCLAICVSRAARVPWWGGLILLEVLFLSPVPYPAHYIEAQPSVALQELQKASEGAVLSAPLAMENLHDLSQALVAQTQHQKPIQDGGIHRRIGSEAKQLFVQNALVSAMSHRDGPVLIEGTAAQKAADELCGLGYRFFLLKRGDKEMEKWAKKWMGEARVQDERWSWWIFPNCINKENP